MLSDAEFVERARRVRLLVLDVDGVLTDGRIVLDDAGVETKAFHVRDGFGVHCWLAAGRKAAVVTGRSAPVVERRCKELGIDPVVQGSPDKATSLLAVLERLELPPEAACCMGDDLPDLPMLRLAGVAATVADAAPEVRARADRVAPVAGGAGAVRWLVEELLRAQGLWDQAVRRYAGN